MFSFFLCAAVQVTPMKGWDANLSLIKNYYFIAVFKLLTSTVKDFVDSIYCDKTNKMNKQ